MKKAIKWIAIIFVVLFIIGLLVPSDDKKDNEVTAASTETKSSVVQDAPQAPKQWREVLTMKGNGAKKSQIFRLSSSNARVKYNYKSELQDMGVFYVYVVDKGVDLMKSGGFPDVSLDKSENGESYLQKSPGEYYLSVDGTGSWDVTVEEEL